METTIPKTCTSEKALPRAEVEGPNYNIAIESSTLHTQSPDLQRRTKPSSANNRPAVLFSTPASHGILQGSSSSSHLDTPCPAPSSQGQYNDEIFALVHPPIQAPIEFNFDTLLAPGPSVTPHHDQRQTNFDVTTPSFDPHPTIPTSLPKQYDILDGFGSLTQDFLFTNDPLPEFAFDGLQFPSFNLISHSAPRPETFMWPGLSSADTTFPDIPTASSFASTPNYDFDFDCADPWSTITQTPWDITTPSLTWS